MPAKKTTRETKFNSYYDKKYMYSAVDATATASDLNIKLLDYDECIYKTGKDINDYSKENNTYKYFKKESSPIETNLDNSQKCYIFGAPMKTVLDNLQQYNNCGVDSVLNNLAIAGIKKITNQNSVETEFTKKLWELGLADDIWKLGVFDNKDGGTNPPVYKEIFEYYGLNAEEYFGQGEEPVLDVLKFSNYIRNGGSAVVGVSSELLWYPENVDENNIGIDHAITVTGVVYDTKNPVYNPEDIENSSVPVGFFIHDTGGWITRYISYEEFLEVTLYYEDVESKTQDGIFATVLVDPVKQNSDNINATGTNQSNIIYGNSGNNVIKGLSGNDYLIGSRGNDTIYGGNGNDIIFANGVDKDSYSGYITDDAIKTAISGIDYVASKEEDSEFVGRNFLYGGNGSDYLFGGAYNDTLEGGSGQDYLFGGVGIDVLKGGSGNDFLYGEAGNDRIYADSGNDYIDAGDGDDTISGGKGNDTIIGGKGSDIIECGSGNDIFIFEKGCDIDTVRSSGGSATLKFSGEENGLVSISDLKISLIDNGSKTKNLKVTFDNLSDGLEFDSFYNVKNNSSKKVYVSDDVHNEAYRISVTKSKGKIKVANKNGNNVLFSTSAKNNTITTSSGNDIVYMTDGDDVITYTSGEDYYFSDQGNNTYNINSFSKDSFLSVNDCTDIIGKTDPEGQPLSPSLNDVMNFKNNESDSLMLFFDIKKTGEINNTSLYILSKTDIICTADYLLDVLDNDTTGMIQIKDYFLKSNPLETANYKGFGCVETISAKGVNLDIASSVQEIVADVISWFEGKDYTSVSDAFEKGAEGLSDLINIYLSAELHN